MILQMLKAAEGAAGGAAEGAAGSGSHLPRGRGSSEGDFGHQRVGAEDLPDRRGLLPGAGNHVVDARWDPRLRRQLQRRQEVM